MTLVNEREYHWQDDAECQGMNFDLFFPLPGHKPPQEVVDACNRCGVSEECRAFGSRTSRDYGVYGGLTPPERRSAERAQRRSRAAGEAA